MAPSSRSSPEPAKNGASTSAEISASDSPRTACGIEPRQLVGNEQAAVRGKAAHHRVDETRFLTARAC